MMRTLNINAGGIFAGASASVRHRDKHGRSARTQIRIGLGDLGQSFRVNRERGMVQSPTLTCKHFRSLHVMSEARATEELRKQVAELEAELEAVKRENEHFFETLKQKRQQAEEELETVKQKRKQAEEELETAKQKRQQAEEENRQTGLLTGYEFLEAATFVPNGSPAPARLQNDVVADVTDVPEDLVELPDGFWKVRVFPLPASLTLSEADVETDVYGLITAVNRALEYIGYISPEYELVCPKKAHLTHVVPDIGLFYGISRRLCGVVEVKKHGEQRINDIFESGSKGAGQSLLQLMLCKMTLRGESYGIMSTFNSVRLFSTGTFKDDLAKCRERIRRIGNKPLEQDETKQRHAGALQMEIRDDREMPKPVDASAAGDADVHMFGYPRVDFAKSGEDADVAVQKNKKMIETIATFLLLAAQSLENGPHLLSRSKPLAGLVRSVDEQTGTLSLEMVSYKSALDLVNFPTRADKLFHVWSQLGEGDNSSCCLATTPQKCRMQEEGGGKNRSTRKKQDKKNAKKEAKNSLEYESAALCVLKIFHKAQPDNAGGNQCSPSERLRDLMKQAEREANNWNTIYTREDWGFVRTLKGFGCPQLVMPYLAVPKNKAEREQLLSGHMDSTLWKGLTAFARMGKKHEDLKWSHVGVLHEQTTDGNQTRTVYFLDLDAIADLKLEDAGKWIEESYELLRDTVQQASDLAPVFDEAIE